MRNRCLNPCLVAHGRLETGKAGENLGHTPVQREFPRPGQYPRAMTLVELLVVITIILVLMAVAIPLVRPALKAGVLREASRQLNAQLALAKARAAQRGQRTGISIQRTAAGANSALDVFIVEEPLPYSGDVVDAKVQLLVLPSTGRVQRAHFDTSGSTLDYSATNSATLFKQVSVGDRIKFDYRGATYVVTGVVPSNGSMVTDISFTPSATICNPGPDRKWGIANTDDDGDGTIDNQTEAYAAGSDDFAPEFPAGSVVPYQLFRQPRRTSVKPLQIASGACVDTQWSGLGAAGTQFAAIPMTVGANTYLDNQPVVILFEPGGSVSSVLTGVFNASTNAFALTEIIVDGPIHLLIGRFEQAAPAPPATSSEAITNLADSTCVWVSVSDRNGSLTSAENDGSAATIDLARIFARSGQNMGGR